MQGVIEMKTVTYVVKNNNGSVLSTFLHSGEAEDFFKKHVMARTLEKVTIDTEILAKKTKETSESKRLVEADRALYEGLKAGLEADLEEE